jgi:HSF-type DNA-binding
MSTSVKSASPSYTRCTSMLMNSLTPENLAFLQSNHQDSQPRQCASKSEQLAPSISEGSGATNGTQDNHYRGFHGMDDMGSECKDASLSEYVDVHLGRKRKYNQRLVTVHSYREHLNDPFLRLSRRERPKNLPPRRTRKSFTELVSLSSSTSINSSRYKMLIFPEKLHLMLHQLENEGLQHICCWKPHGRCFVIGDKDEFASAVAPR